MHLCSLLIEQVFILSAQEEKALMDEDADQAGEIAEHRAGLLQRIWNERAGYDEALLGEQLMRIKVLHERLRERAAALFDKLNSEFSATRKQNKSVAGYGRSGSHMGLKAYYCHKIS